MSATHKKLEIFSTPTPEINTNSPVSLTHFTSLNVTKRDKKQHNNSSIVINLQVDIQSAVDIKRGGLVPL